MARRSSTVIAVRRFSAIFSYDGSRGTARADQEAASRRDRAALHDGARRRARPQRRARRAARDRRRRARRDPDRAGDQAARRPRGAGPAALRARAGPRHRAGQLARDDRRRLHRRDRRAAHQPRRPHGPDRARTADRPARGRAGRAGRARRGQRATGHGPRRRRLRIDGPMTGRSRRSTQEGTGVFDPERRRALLGTPPGAVMTVPGAAPQGESWELVTEVTPRPIPVEQATPTRLDTPVPVPPPRAAEQATPTELTARPERSEPI